MKKRRIVLEQQPDGKITGYRQYDVSDGFPTRRAMSSHEAARLWGSDSSIETAMRDSVRRIIPFGGGDAA